MRPLPVNVKDKYWYDQFIKLSNHNSLAYPSRLIETSDGTSIDPLGHIDLITENITDLPEHEQSVIIKRCKAVKLLYDKLLSYKKKAFVKNNTVYRRSVIVEDIFTQRKDDIIALYSEMLDDREVCRIIRKDWSYDVSLKDIKSFASIHNNDILSAQEQFRRDFSEIKLSHKKGRLQELVKFYNDRKSIYHSTNTKADLDSALKILKMIKDEVDQPSLRIDHHISGELEVNINHHIENEVMKDMVINDIIVARVASRMNINPAFILARLHRSYYSKHSGFIQPDTDLQSQEIIYPSSLVYNWNTIKQQHESRGDTDLDLTEYEDVTEQQSNQANNLKQLLLKKIHESRSQ